MGRRSWGTAVATALTAWACQPPAGPATEPAVEGPATVEELAGALRATGATVQVGDPTAPSLFTVPGRLLYVDGAQVEAFAFPDAAAAEAEVPRFTGALVLWVAPARLYGEGPLLLLQVGAAGDTTRRLARVLGPPLASVGTG